jgi:N-acetyl-gamma-glutamyl-phosphate reductase
MFEQFTDRAREAMARANKEALRWNHEYVGTEHILLALVKDGSCTGSKILIGLGVDLSVVPVEVEKLIKHGPDMVSMGRLPHTPRAKKVLEYAIEEARTLGHEHVGTEHLLVGLIREQDGVAAQILRNVGLKLEDVRKEVLNVLGAGPNAEDRMPPAPKVNMQPMEYGVNLFRVGIVGVSGYGGGEVLRLCATHTNFRVDYVAGEGSAGQKLSERFPGIGRLGDLVIQKWNPDELPELDLLFASLPTGQSKEALAKLPAGVKIVDIGGDHRYVEGWTYGLADVWPEMIKKATRVANPGCYPSAALIAIAPLLNAGLIDWDGPVIIDAKSGVSGAGRGGGDSKFGYAEVNEDVSAYALLKHVHLPEIKQTLKALSPGLTLRVTFTPHLIPMTRGILATCYLSGKATTEECLAAARAFYADRPFVKVVDQPPHTKWATGSNLAFVSYAAAGDGGPIIALGAIDNLGKGAAGQAVQNANLMCGLRETTGLEQAPMWP